MKERILRNAGKRGLGIVSHKDGMLRDVIEYIARDDNLFLRLTVFLAANTLKSNIQRSTAKPDISYWKGDE